MRSRSGTVRLINARHRIDKLQSFSVRRLRVTEHALCRPRIVAEVEEAVSRRRGSSWTCVRVRRLERLAVCRIRAGIFRGTSSSVFAEARLRPRGTRSTRDGGEAGLRLLSDRGGTRRRLRSVRASSTSRAVTCCCSTRSTSGRRRCAPSTTGGRSAAPWQLHDVHDAQFGLEVDGCSRPLRAGQRADPVEPVERLLRAAAAAAEPAPGDRLRKPSHRARGRRRTAPSRLECRRRTPTCAVVAARRRAAEQLRQRRHRCGGRRPVAVLRSPGARPGDGRHLHRSSPRGARRLLRRACDRSHVRRAARAVADVCLPRRHRGRRRQPVRSSVRAPLGRRLATAYA